MDLHPDLHEDCSFVVRTMRPDEVALAIDWAAAEGWNPGLNDAACFAAAAPDGFLLGELAAHLLPVFRS